jgi:excisionase family DNA binding protein
MSAKCPCSVPRHKKPPQLLPRIWKQQNRVEETVDAFGIPFVGFLVQKRTRPRTGQWGNKPIWIEPEEKKAKFGILVPNVRSWAVNVVQRLSEIVEVNKLAETLANPVAQVRVRPVVGGSKSQAARAIAVKLAHPAEYPTMTLAEVRSVLPVSRSTIYRYVDEGRLKRPKLGKKIGRRTRFLVLTTSVARMLQESDL